MTIIITSRTLILASILTTLSVGSYTYAQNRVVVVPMGENDSTPGGAVMAFNREACPAGWSKFTNARGRVIVGLNQGGTLNAQVETSLANEAVPIHNHVWAIFTGGTQNDWSTANEFGHLISLTQWSNGMDTVGAGHYPISANDTTSYTAYHTGNESSGMPYVQLLYCEKS